MGKVGEDSLDVTGWCVGETNHRVWPYSTQIRYLWFTSLVARFATFSWIMSMGIVIVGFLPFFIATEPDYNLPLLAEFILLLCLIPILRSELIRFAPKLSARQLQSLFMLWGIFFIYYGGRIAAFIVSNWKSSELPCSQLIPHMQKIECFLHPAVNQFIGMRLFFTHGVALVIFTLSIWASAIPATIKKMTALVLAGPSLLVLTWLCSLIAQDHRILPTFFGTTHFWGKATHIFPNPGWVWPYLSAGLASAVFILQRQRHQKFDRIWLGVLCSLLGLMSISTGQRGALFSVLLMLTCLLIYWQVEWFKKNKNLCMGFIAPALLGFFTIFIALQHKLASEIRIKIWRLGYSIFKTSPLWGTGPGTWYIESKKAGTAADSAHIFDTAHNFLVQALVEHGLIGSLVFFVTFFVILWAFYRDGTKHDKLALTMTLLMCIIILSIQEIDYVRAIYYYWALAGGFILGSTGTHLQTSSSSNREVAQQRLSFAKYSSAIITWSSGIFLVVCAISFGLGSYGFEKIPGAHPLGRWVRPASFVSVFPASIRSTKSYAIAAIERGGKDRNTEATSYALMRNGSQELHSAPLYAGESYLTFKPGKLIFPRIHYLYTNRFQIDQLRILGFIVKYPWHYTNISMSWSQGMYGWESLQKEEGRWCQQECQFIAESCGQESYDLYFRLQAPRPDVEHQPLHVQLRAYRGEHPTLALNEPPLEERNYVFDSGQKTEEVHIKAFPPVLVRLNSESIFNPQERGLSSDNRNLGVLLLEPLCKQTKE